MDFYSFIWNCNHQEQIDEQDKRISLQERQIVDATTELHSAEQKIRELQLRTANLASTCQVLCDTLVTKLGISQSDLQDAILDSISEHSIKTFGVCPSCGRSFLSGRSWCIYCGKKAKKEPKQTSDAP